MAAGQQTLRLALAVKDLINIAYLYKYVYLEQDGTLSDMRRRNFQGY